MKTNRPPHRFQVVRKRLRSPLLLLAALPLLLLASACGASQAAGGMDQPDPPQSVTAEKDGVQLTISPSSGPIGTAVDVRLAGVRTNTFAPYGVLSLKDASGAFGEDELTTDYVLDTRAVGAGGSLQLTYHIPANVLVKASPDEQNPTQRAATTAGTGAIVFSSADVEVEVPFTVVEGDANVGVGDLVDVRGIVAALLSRDEAALAPHVGLTTAACTASSVDAASGQPMCERGIEAGTDVPFLPEVVTGVCRTAVRQRAIQSSELGQLAHSLVPDDSTNLYAVYRSPGMASYTIVLVRAASDDGYGVIGALLTLDGGNLTGVRRHCGDIGDDTATLSEFVAGVQPNDFLVGPPRP